MSNIFKNVGGVMEYIQIFLLAAILIVGIVFIVKRFAGNKKEEGFSTILLTAGLELIVTSFGTIQDKILPIVTLLKVSVNAQEASNIIDSASQVNVVQLITGFVLLIAGAGLYYYTKNKIYVLNINGYFDKRIENHHKDLGLSAFEFKEREIDFIRTFNKGISDEISNDIIEEIKSKVEPFKNESKEFKRGYTGIAPIPFIMLAGTLMKKEKINEYYEYDKKETQKYYKLTKGRGIFRKKYQPLKLVTDINSINIGVNEVVVAVTVTSDITDADLAQFNGKEVVKLAIAVTCDNAIRYKEQLREYTCSVYDTIEQLGKLVKGLRKIHLVYSGQSCLALEIGKVIDDNRMPQIINYQYKNQAVNRYPWGIIMNGDCKGEYVEYIQSEENE